MASIIDPGDVNQAMIEGLTNCIREKLRERIMEKIEPDIEAAIETALADFKTTIETWRDPHLMRDTVRVLIERRNAPKQ